MLVLELINYAGLKRELSKMIKHYVVIFLLVCSFNSTAGPVADLFSDGIWGLSWGSNKDQVKKVFPKGKLVKYGNIELFEVKDGRSIFGVERANSMKIAVGFDAENRMAGASIYFASDAFVELQQKLITEFGAPLPPQANATGATVLQWDTDNGVVLSLSHFAVGFSTNTVLSIGFEALPKPTTDKKSLGF